MFHMCLTGLWKQRVEKVADPGISKICVTTWHKMKIVLQLLTEPKRADDICDLLRRLLQVGTANNHSGAKPLLTKFVHQNQAAKMKGLKTFTRTCSSEMILAGAPVTFGGLSLRYGGIERDLR